MLSVRDEERRLNIDSEEESSCVCSLESNARFTFETPTRYVPGAARLPGRSLRERASSL